MSSEQDAVEQDKYGWIMASEFKPPADGPLLPYVMTMDGQPMSASRVRLLLNRLEAQRKENERLREAGRGMLKLVEETTDDRGLPYIFPYADEIKEMKAALEETKRISGG